MRQHAYNPVDWHPWGEEALAKARREDKPIFLSIGYSTCHWCHVMERESFENEEIAAFLNDHFVPIKVDREERPDLDNLYMSAVQGMTGQGGWPMSVFLTPHLEPFFAGTYFPPDDRYGRPGFRSLLANIAEAWADHRGELVAQAGRVGEFLREQSKPAVGSTVRLEAALLDSAARVAEASYDTSLGGFGGAPKFPTPHKLTFLLRYAARVRSDTAGAKSAAARVGGGAAAAKSDAARAMVRGTLDALAAGGIHDHLGGGFHRYSTDARWLVPHFEKMLYDQAGLALAYTDGWLVFGDPRYAMVVRGILEYVIRDLGNPEGGYYAAEDADSEGQEGTFYVWSAAEIDSVLGAERGLSFRKYYRASDIGNWEGKNILHVDSFTREGVLTLRAEREELFRHRAKRPRPHRDEKILAGWNGFMIEAMARAGSALGEPRYVENARRAAEFVESHLWKNGRLLRHYRDGAASVAAYLDDYAFLGRGYLALYEATFDVHWLERAIHLVTEIERLFRRPEGGYALAGIDAETLLAPVVETYDGAMPSGNSAAAMFLLRLGHLTGDRAIKDHGWGVLETFAGSLGSRPDAHLEMLSALDFALGPNTEVIVAGDAADPTVDSMWNAVRARYLPNAVFALRPAGDGGAIIALVPYLEAQVAIDGKPTAYVCRSYACRLPVHDLDALEALLQAP